MLEVPTFQFALREDLEKEELLQFLPTKGEPLATGWDCRAAQEDRKDIVVRNGDYFKIPLGFRSFCPDGWWYQLHPRSSSFVKKSMHNLIGIVDQSWEGYTLFAGQYIASSLSLGNDLIIKFGDPIAQIIPVRRENMNVNIISNKDYDELCKRRGATRKDGGFGSTSENKK